MNRIPLRELLKSPAQLRGELIAKLGGKCVTCKSTDNLELDHINGRDWKVESVAQTVRMQRYNSEGEKGLLQVLCGTCNKQKGTKYRYRGPF